MRELKFRQPHLNIKEEFIDWFYWGFTDEGGFTSPPKFHLPNYQFTGLKDKNGVEIYEGDVIVCWIKGVGKPTASVTFQEGSFWVGGRVINESYCREVLGNIYENPELV